MTQNTAPRTTAEWLTLLRERDPEVCYELWQICLYICRREFRSWFQIDPEDIANEAWIKVLTEAENPKHNPQMFVAWAHTIVRNVCLDKKRKLHKMPLMEEVSDTLADSREPSAATDTPERAALYLALDACIAACADHERQLAEWYKEGQGPAWIAKRLESIEPTVTANRISQRLHRLWRKLKKCLAGKEFTSW